VIRPLALGFALLAAAALDGCVVAPPAHEPGADELCRGAFQAVDRAVADAAVGDGLAARIEGFPHLRADRFLASYATQPMSEAQFDEWLERLLALGNTAREYEIANLPPNAWPRSSGR